MANDKTNNTQDTELRELCKQVYEATGWEMPKSSRNRYVIVHGGHINSIVKTKPTSVAYAPLYSSDFLLDKLTEESRDFLDISITASNDSLNIICEDRRGSYGLRPIGVYDCGTMLKALLKLTIALHEDAELL